MKNRNLACAIFLFFTVEVALLPATYAEKICLRIKTTPRTRLVRKVVSSGECARGFVEIIDTSSIYSPYGDGSKGTLTVSSSTTFDQANAQYTDVVINAGTTLTVLSGTEIRCTGTFKNNGAITVSAYSVAGRLSSFFSTTPSQSAPDAGISRTSAGLPGISPLNTVALGGLAGAGMVGLFGGDQTAKAILRPGPKGGGAGAPAAGSIDIFNGSYGGGTLVIKCKGAVTNASTINADGESASLLGNGGGGGGIVILASQTSVSNTGTITVKGGNGGPASNPSGAGGGGGGGIVHMIAPEISSTGTVSVSGGAGRAASAAGTVNTNPWSGGGAGGSCYGAGGNGGLVNTNGSSAESLAGGDGAVYQTVADPTSLL